MIGIYKITNPNNKVYIGQSVNTEKRFTDYKYISSTKQYKIRKSIEKYGLNNHIFEIVEECKKELLNERERYYQELFDCLNNGLNCRVTKTNDKSGYLSEETKIKISEKRKGIKSSFKNNKQRLINISKALTGKKLSVKHREALSKAQTGLKRSPEAILKSANARKGIKQSSDFIVKITKRQTGGTNSFAKITLNTENGIFYETAKEAAESIGMTYNQFNHYMNGRTKRKLSFIYV